MLEVGSEAAVHSILIELLVVKPLRIHPLHSDLVIELHCQYIHSVQSQVHTRLLRLPRLRVFWGVCTFALSPLRFTPLVDPIARQVVCIVC